MIEEERLRKKKEEKEKGFWETFISSLLEISVIFLLYTYHQQLNKSQYIFIEILILFQTSPDIAWIHAIISYIYVPIIIRFETGFLPI